MYIELFIDLYLHNRVMVHVHNQEQKTYVAKKIAEMTGVSSDGMASYSESSPFIGKRQGFKSGSYGFKGKSDITIDYEEFIEMIEGSANDPDVDAIFGLL